MPVKIMFSYAMLPGGYHVEYSDGSREFIFVDSGDIYTLPFDARQRAMQYIGQWVGCGEMKKILTQKIHKMPA